METSTLSPTMVQLSGTKPPGPGLLDLPKELRDLIFNDLIIKTRTTITMLSDFDYYRNEISAAPPGLCNVNKQLRHETLPGFYSSNTFSAQLDNEQDLDTAKRWVAAIGNENVRHLRKLALSGWTKVPFGNVCSRRWVKIIVDLKDASLVMESSEPLLMAHDEPSDSLNTIEELNEAFKRLVDQRQGGSFDVGTIKMLMDGFNALCSGY